ncbi:uncharacterized protein LOC133200085 [Saccostrea echinata]|uniref:uncharacterized protein LOC133200085 n=1 Tax=Saccostrea echinata TaxID=191078 RepID=UPI002A828576|nr:uncharacterized protein LOC133200085 [Saccostrea echinata]
MEHLVDEVTTAQVLIPCFLCPNKAELICNTCKFNLCVTCAGQHVISLPTQNHDVIKYSMKYKFFPQPCCSIHSDQRCEIHCQQCNLPICSDCIVSKAHSEHELSKINEVYAVKEKTIYNEIEFLKCIIAPEVRNIVEQIQKDILELPKNSIKLKSNVTKHGEELHRTVECAIKKQLENIDAAEKQDLDNLKNNLSEFQKLLDNIHEIIKKNEEIIATRTDQIFTFESQLEVMSQIPQRLYISFAQFQPASAPMNEVCKLMGNLQSSTLKYTTEIDWASKLHFYNNFLATPSVTTDIDTECCPLYRISCLKNEKAWINGNDDTLREINPTGLVLRKVTAQGSIPFGLATTRTGELLYTDYSEKSVKMLNDGKLRTLIRCVWIPSGICVSSSGDKFVALCNDRISNLQFIVMQYSGGIIKHTFQFDEQKQNLFATEGPYKCLQIALNKNGDICIVDWNGAAVIILNQKGCLKTKYCCKTNPKLPESFAPRYIATDSHNHILVSDTKNNCIHILDSEGVPLTVLKCGLVRPCGISIDSDNHLWVAEQAGKVKIIKFLK